MIEYDGSTTKDSFSELCSLFQDMFMSCPALNVRIFKDKYNSGKNNSFKLKLMCDSLSSSRDM